MAYEYNIDNLTQEEIHARSIKKMQIVKAENIRMIVTMVIFSVINLLFYIILSLGAIGLFLGGLALGLDSGADLAPAFTESTQTVATQMVESNNNVNNSFNNNVSNNINNNFDDDLERLDIVYTEVMVYGNRDYLYNFSSEDLAIIRNTLYASKGYIFSKEKYRRYFGSKDWYSGYTKNPVLTNEEKQFVEIIKQYE